MRERLLLLEDDQSLVEGLIYALSREEYVLDVAQTEAEARTLLKENRYDLLLFDVTLPDGNGIDLCVALRQEGHEEPIIFLTAVDEEVQLIRALDGGGDDYVTKPFKLGELCSRIRAQLRRSGLGRDAGVLCSGDVCMKDGHAYLKGKLLSLTATELKLLAAFLRNKGQVLTREMLLTELWDAQERFVDDNTLSVYIRRLREKIEVDPSHPAHLCTVRGIGYEWREKA